MSFEYIRKYYKVPAERGRRVDIDGKQGVIASAEGCYIGVLFDDCKPNDIRPYHPTHFVKYMGMGEVRKMTRSQKRYRNYLKNSDLYNSFAEYLGIKNEMP